MTSQISLAVVWAYVCQHWFKLSLLLLILFACFRKELIVHFRLNPDSEDQRTEQKKLQPTSTNKITVADNGDTAEGTPLSIFENVFGNGRKDEVIPVVDEATKGQFIRRFAHVTVAERKKYGIPSSLIMANALRQSFAGKRDMTLKSNNHFALPCSFDWNGAGDNYGKDCFRRYENAWVSFRDHSIFITSGKFSKLRSLGATNYKAWANGLESLGYPSGTENLARDLIKIIETYELEKLDNK